MSLVDKSWLCGPRWFSANRNDVKLYWIDFYSSYKTFGLETECFSCKNQHILPE